MIKFKVCCMCTLRALGIALLHQTSDSNTYLFVPTSVGTSCKRDIARTIASLILFQINCPTFPDYRLYHPFRYEFIDWLWLLFVLMHCQLQRTTAKIFLPLMKLSSWVNGWQKGIIKAEVDEEALNVSLGGRDVLVAINHRGLFVQELKFRLKVLSLVGLLQSNCYLCLVVFHFGYMWWWKVYIGNGKRDDPWLMLKTHTQGTLFLIEGQKRQEWQLWCRG